MGFLSDNLKAVRQTIPAGVKLVVVSKYRPLEQLEECYEAGERVFAESRPLEFEAKAKALPGDIEWHFIGHLQTNKLRHVLPYAALVQSVDSEHLLDAIQKYSASNGLKTGVLLEVHIGRELTKQGFAPEQVLDLVCGPVASGRYPDVTVRGLMGMASHTDDSARIEADFALLEGLFREIRSRCPALTDFDQLSMGMSDDYPIALRHSATMVRIGSAIFENDNEA